MTPPHLRPYDSVLQTVGWTPLIRLGRIGAGLRTPIYGKAEYANPGGSVKDRIGFAIIADAERRGELKPGGTIVEGTSGNTGVGLAIAAALRGYRCVFTMPDKMSMEKVRLLKAYGAEVVVTPTAVPPDHPEHYVMKAKQIVHDTPNAILANQFYNQVNPEAHYASTGPEIWQQTEGRVTHFVAGAGTGGTVSGAGKYLKEQNPKIRVIAGDPVGSLYTQYHRTHTMGEGHPYKVEGIGGDKIPSTVWFDWIDEFRQVSDKTSFLTARRLAREEGILLGGSSGLNVAIALDLARELADPEALIVTILCDTGERYLSKQFNDAWMQENQMLDTPRSTVQELLQRRPADAPAVVSVAPAAAVRQALNLMATWSVSQIPVLDGGQSVGGLIEGTLMARALAQPALLERPVSEIMEPPFPEVDAGTAVDRVGAMLTRESPAALVRRDGKLVGIVSRYDVLQQLIGGRS
ncbi:MAG TPA: pyridoxal-phosphate dependent enzyme [Gemmatimonadales bacterium]|nr:pyridoxal-phosphate dependent enzyme [Gemmatimonadales bacterium]